MASESASRSAAGSVSRTDVMNGAMSSPMTGTWSASSTSRTARKSLARRLTSARVSLESVANVTVSANFDGQRLGVRPANGHDDRRVNIGTVQISQRRHGFADLGQSLPWWRHGHPQLAEFVLDPWPPSADAHLEATFSEQGHRVRLPCGAPGGAQWGGVDP